MLRSGIPTRTEYKQLPLEPEYEELLGYSRQFEARCGKGGIFSGLYGLKWVKDPFLQWSRSWEYVYVLQRLREWCQSHSETVDVADAGSGFTFFPFYLQEHWPCLRIRCLDADVTVAKAMAEVRRSSSFTPCFHLEKLEQMKQASCSLDVIYSISVIEHTRNPPRVVSEIHRVLKPGGLFLCTFDISFERQSKMHVRHIGSLLAHINEIFDSEQRYSAIEITGDASNPDAVTTGWIAKVMPEKLPWRYPWALWLYDAFRGRLRTTKYRPMTFFCNSFRKV
jgi:SAM-dependent methyltransferase